MFKDSNVFEFINFPIKTKYSNTVVCSVNSNCLYSTRKQEKKLLKQFLEKIYCEFINILSKLDDF